MARACGGRPARVRGRGAAPCCHPVGAFALADRRRRVAWLARPSQFPRAVEADRADCRCPVRRALPRWSAAIPMPILCSKKASRSTCALPPRHLDGVLLQPGDRSRSGEPSGRPVNRSATATKWNSAAAARCPRGRWPRLLSNALFRRGHARMDDRRASRPHDGGGPFR